jgi:hemoglobin/transferrin/lactoferrin receptor protein
MKQLLLILAFTLFSAISFSQKIQVLSQEDNTPIPGVAIFNSNKSKSGVTDFDGYVSIFVFDTNEVITFQHCN